MALKLEPVSVQWQAKSALNLEQSKAHGRTEQVAHSTGAFLIARQVTVYFCIFSGSLNLYTLHSSSFWVSAMVLGFTGRVCPGEACSTDEKRHWYSWSLLVSVARSVIDTDACLFSMALSSTDTDAECYFRRHRASLILTFFFFCWFFDDRELLWYRRVLFFFFFFFFWWQRALPWYWCVFFSITQSLICTDVCILR